MHIKMNTNVVGPGVYFARNSVYDVPDNQAAELVTAKFANPAIVAATPAEKREKATRKPHETR